jgi:hypothetical protein
MHSTGSRFRLKLHGSCCMFVGGHIIPFSVHFTALSQSCLFEAESENRISENQWLARLNFPVFGNLRQSPP